MSGMRIAVWHNLPSGGAKRALYYHLKGLVERGHYVELWCPPTADRLFWPLGGFAQEHIVDLPRPIHRPLANRLMWPYLNVMNTLRSLDVHCAECAVEINAGGFDVLFSNACMLTRTAPIARYCTCRGLIYLQEPFRPLYEALPELPWRAPSKREGGLFQRVRTLAHDELRVRALRIQAREEWTNARAFKRILVNSLFSRESILRAYGLESVVCYLGVDTGLFVPAKTRGDYVVGVGNIDLNKGIARVLAALSTVPTPHRPPLVWIGNYANLQHLSELHAEAATRGVTLATRIAISDAELARTIAQARVMVYAPYLEPFGLAVLEAAACGTPVVAVAEGGVREIVRDGETGVLLPDAEPNALGSAVLSLLLDRERAERLGKNARRHAEHSWSWHSAVDRLEQSLSAIQETPWGGVDT